MSDLIRLTGASRSQLEFAIAKNDAIVMSGDERAVTRRWIESKRSALVIKLGDFHKANPNAAGAPLAS